MKHHRFNKSVMVVMFTLLTITFSIVGTAHAAGGWGHVGPVGISSGVASRTSLAVDNGIPYVAYSDWDNNYQIRVKKFNGTGWEYVGSSSFTVDYAGAPSLAIDNGIPYISYAPSEIETNDGKARVMKFNGANWVYVGLAGFSPGKAGDLSLAVDNGTPYVVFADEASDWKISVMKFDGTNWVYVGSAGFSAGDALFPSLVVDNGTPYVAYQDTTNSNKASVMKFDGLDWVYVGSPGFSPGEAWWISFAINNGTPYISYQDISQSKAIVMKFDGADWIGSGEFSSWGDYTLLTTDNGTPYVAYPNTNDGRSSVKKFDGTDWIYVGSAGFSAGLYYDLAIDNDTPYIAYSNASDGKASVMKFYTILSTTIPFKSNNTQDSWILESSETSNKGGTLNSTATLLYIGDDAQDKQFKSILSFNTTSLPDDAIITKVQLKVKVNGFIGGNMFTPIKTLGNLVIDIRKSYFGSNANSTVSDFQATASKSNVGALTSVSGAGWYTITLNSTAYDYVNRTDTTQLRLRFTKDDNDDLAADYLKIFSGNAPAANRPQLIIEYYVP